MSIITNKDNVIDSRDIISRIEELENEIEERGVDGEGLEELNILRLLAEEGEKYADDWEHGEMLIHEDYFKEYMDEMVEDCYDLPKDLPSFMTIVLDYDALKMDYTEIDFNGETYFIR